ncbi:fungal specific transcription factor [Ceratocystis lukuohia]|uniref:Fungal specific transcription factor n=1 Tax=Ceratocystis lukuohia TaxID=2019550 RepID=A0ABR4MFT9_9PEZI
MDLNPRAPQGTGHRASAMRITNLLLPEQPSAPPSFNPGHRFQAPQSSDQVTSSPDQPPLSASVPHYYGLAAAPQPHSNPPQPPQQLSLQPPPLLSQSQSHPEFGQNIAVAVAPQKRHYDGSIVQQTNWGPQGSAPRPGADGRASEYATTTTVVPTLSRSNPEPQGSFYVFPLPESESRQGSTASSNILAPHQLKKTTRIQRHAMRSTIACLNCRKSKIKCENQGPGGACETCIKAGKECRYNDGSLSLKQVDSHPVVKADKEVDKDRERDRKRFKRYGDIINPDMSQVVEITRDNLSRDFLTVDLWNKIFDLYEQHFSPELPFIHVQTLKDAIRRKLQQDEELPHDTNLVLLGLLALTARFHRDLGKYVSHFNIGYKHRNNSSSNNNNNNHNNHNNNNSGSNSSNNNTSPKLDTNSASPFYAQILVIALGRLPSALVVPGVERVQALLMLGVHEWLQGSSPKASTMYIDAAIRLALSMKMNRELDAPDMPLRYRGSIKPNNSLQEQQNANLAAEIRRRTMFSCFVLDRFVNLGEDTSWMLPAENIRLRLPAYDWGGEKSQSNEMLWPRKSSLNITDAIYFDNEISFFVRLIDIWGEISKYSADGGRALDGPNPPWAESRFKLLNDTLRRLTACMPASLALSKANYFRCRVTTGSLYISTHTIICLCKIMLHREYVPFVALRCQGPIGPLDPPLLPPAPEDFWLDSANILFEASRDIVRLVEWSGDHLPFSPITLFGVWTAAFVGLYARHFPHMDLNCHMFDPNKEFNYRREVNITESGATGIAFGALKKMASCMAAGAIWKETFTYCDNTFHEISRRFNERQTRRAESNEALTPGASLETPGGKDLWDNGYGGRITGNSVILTIQSPGHRQNATAGGEYGNLGMSMPCSPSDRDGPDTPRDQLYGVSVSAEGAEQYDDADANEDSDFVLALRRLTFLEIGQWIKKEYTETGKSPDAEALLEWAEKIHWGQTFPGQTNYLDKSLEVH